ncbi:hypothetical protein L1987_17672 [Smallanthus sonchifolius]|uniref:Uncharacterized protein n=1 Tax=Smallanthus sonchifolius TaxID=185202 RepID=A0ACB9IYG2_9ASTR|nr:hypothetical protein L1987_17672 [Smallanthus sonchifolius]
MRTSNPSSSLKKSPLQFSIVFAKWQNSPILPKAHFGMRWRSKRNQNCWNEIEIAEESDECQGEIIVVEASSFAIPDDDVTTMETSDGEERQTMEA